MEFSEIDALLCRKPLPLEMGISRLPSGQVAVASRADMRGVKGEMVDWWFGWFNTTEHYTWWHPIDHKYLKWDDRWSRGSYIGATCTVDETLDMGAGGPCYRLQIKFHDPADIFDRDRLANAYASGEVSAIVCATIGFGDQPDLDEHGDPIGGRFIHTVYDTVGGCVMRSRFWLGDRVPAGPEVLAQQVPDQLGIDLMQHANVEYTYLARVLPNLYHGEHPSLEAMAAAW